MKKKGFTLIELLAAIVIISLLFVVSFTVVKNVFDDSNDNLDKADEKMILNVANQYVLEYRNSDDWNEEKDESGKLTSCITMDSLINYGYFKFDDASISKYKDYFIKVIVNDNSRFDYELIKTEDDNVVKNCKYYVANVSSISGGSGGISGGGEDDSYQLTQNFTEVSENRYKMEVNFSKEIYKEEIQPLYVLFVLDISGSMRSNDSSGKAKTAIKNFGEDILNNVTNSKIGFLPFGDNAYPKKFGDSYWTDDILSFNSMVTAVGYGGSNYYNLAYNAILNTYGVEELNKKSMLYIVLFSDAGDGPKCNDPEGVNFRYVVNEISPNVDKFIFVAYTPSNRNCLSNFSSEINSKYPDRSLHYLSTSSDVSSVLSNISNKIREETEYKNVEISIEIDKEYFMIEADSSWNVNPDENILTKTIDFGSFEEEEEIETNLSFDIIYNEKTNIGSESKEVAIIKKFVLKFEKNDGTVEIVSLTEDNLPKSTLTVTEHSVIN